MGEEGLPPPTVVVVKRSPPPKPPRLGAKMRRLSEDLKEERLHAANGKLAMAFDLLTRMKVGGTAGALQPGTRAEAMCRGVHVGGVRRRSVWPRMRWCSAR